MRPDIDPAVFEYQRKIALEEEKFKAAENIRTVKVVRNVLLGASFSLSTTQPETAGVLAVGAVACQLDIVRRQKQLYNLSGI